MRRFRPVWHLAAVRAVVVAQVGLALPRLVACDCSPPPACQAYSLSPMVLVGTVTDAVQAPDGFRGAAAIKVGMRVDRAYKGVSESSLVLYDDGMCGSGKFEPGEQYLMYTRRDEDGAIPARGCTGSRHVRLAKEDLRYLEGWHDAAPTARIFGRVAAWGERSGDPPQAAGATVRLSRPDATLTTKADERGAYSFEGLSPGKYSFSASLAGFHMPERDHGLISVTVESRGCAVVDLTLRKNWPGSISGRLIRPDGAPAGAGVDLWLIRLGESEEGAKGVFAGESHTDEHGAYTFRHLTAGRYKVVVHGCCFPVPEAPYPAIYWPAGRTEEEGWEILVSDADVAQRRDFFLPPAARSATVSGQVVLPDGKPSAGTRLMLLWKPDESQVDDVSQCCGIVDSTVSDAEGRFSFPMMEGLKYILSITPDGEALHADDVPLSFGDSRSPVVVRLKGLN